MTWLHVLVAFGAWLALSVLIGRFIDYGMNGRSHQPPAQPAAVAPQRPARADALAEWDMEAELAGMDWTW
jgi:hypothetical protein